MRYRATTEGKKPNNMQRSNEKEVAVKTPAFLPNVQQKTSNIAVTISTPTAADSTNCPPMRSAVIKAETAISFAEKQARPCGSLLLSLISVCRNRKIIDDAVYNAER